MMRRGYRTGRFKSILGGRKMSEDGLGAAALLWVKTLARRAGTASADSLDVFADAAHRCDQRVVQEVRDFDVSIDQV